MTAAGSTAASPEHDARRPAAAGAPAVPAPPIIPADAPLLACGHCDTLYREPVLARSELLKCRGCGQVLLRGGTPDTNTTFALSITALIVDVFANVYPVIQADAQGQHTEATLAQAILAMTGSLPYVPVALFLAFVMIVAPALQIGLLAWLTGYARQGRRAPGFVAAMRVVELTRPWSMVEVFVVGALVTVVKLSNFLDVSAGVGLYAQLGLTLLITLLAGRSTRGLWHTPEHALSPLGRGQSGGPQAPPTSPTAGPLPAPPPGGAGARSVRACEYGLVGCHACGLVSSAPPAHAAANCPRCSAPLHARHPNSLMRSWAFLLAGLACYIPANLLPVMYTNQLGQAADNTILGGVLEFWREGSWDIALIIFIASIAVPSIKFVVLGLLLTTAQRGSGWARTQRARLYRLIELIGYWSMLDVAVVGLVCALVHFGPLGLAEPRLGIVFFGAVVVLTMLSAMSFDPRLIWDGAPNEHGHA